MGTVKTAKEGAGMPCLGVLVPFCYWLRSYEHGMRNQKRVLWKTDKNEVVI